MHRSGAVFVRVAPGGLVLLPNVHWRDNEEVLREWFGAVAVVGYRWLGCEKRHLSTHLYPPFASRLSSRYPGVGRRATLGQRNKY